MTFLYRTFLVALAAVLVAGTVTSMSQTIGLANAQSQQGSVHACPQGFTLSQGLCTAPQPTTFQRSPNSVAGSQAILQGNTCSIAANL